MIDRPALLICLIALLAPTGFAQDVRTGDNVKSPVAVQSFLKKQCFDCHAGEGSEAGLDIESLPANLSDASVFAKWVRIADRVRLGEMPPRDSSELTRPQRTQFAKTAGNWLRDYQRRENRTKGRVRAKRLTNLQLERTLHDLLGIDIPLAAELPDEPRTNGFTTVADGQPMSHFQLERHLGLIDTALDEAFRRVTNGDDDKLKKFRPRQLVRRNPRRRTREPEMLNGAAVVWKAKTTYYGRLPATTARVDGWYRFTVNASALNKPDDRGVWCSVLTGRCVSSAPLLTWVCGFETTNEKQEWTFDAWLPKGHMLEIRPADATLKNARFQGGQIGAGEGEPQNVPGLAIHSMTLQRIYKHGDSDQVRTRLFGNLNVTASGGRDRLQVESARPRKDIERLVRRFASRAFRRPVPDADLAPFVKLALDVFENERSVPNALRAGYRAVLCSPRFLYFNELPGRLDDHALASRLSYFLWNTMPDDQLQKLAATGRLRNKNVLHKQVERMLDADRGQEFIKDFAHEWLELSEIDFTQPDPRRHRDFDMVVQQSMLDETHAFLQSMLSENLSVTNLIDSDFTFLNSRLARFYDIDGVTGDELRRVELLPRHHRGGVLTQGAVLKVTANGTTTSPVVRGVWVAERLLGQHIPPPPEGIPAIEPDIRGAKTIREMLAKHRSDASCASCHRKIDPPGFALENFDPSGKWRDKYYHRNREKRLAINPAYELADGRSFKNVEEFRKLVVAKPYRLAHNVAEKLVTYGTGAPVGFSDRYQVSEFVKQTADGNYGFRSLVHAVVESPIFRTK